MNALNSPNDGRGPQVRTALCAVLLALAAAVPARGGTASAAGSDVRGEELRDAVGTFELFAPGDDKRANTTITSSQAGGRFRWSGAYVGVNLGGAMGVSSLRTSVAAPGTYFLPSDIAQIGDIGPMNAAPNGFVGGLQAGYNHQSGSLVYGLEADVNALQLEDTESVTAMYNAFPTTSFTISQSIRTDWLVTVRPRIGLAIGDLLLYGTAGVAVTKLKYTEQYTDDFNPANPGFGSESISETRLGWSVGAGGEYALREHWTIKGEYLYADFGKISGTSALANPVVGKGDRFNHSATLNVHLVRLGLNYKF